VDPERRRGRLARVQAVARLVLYLCCCGLGALLAIWAAAPDLAERSLTEVVERYREAEGRIVSAAIAAAIAFAAVFLVVRWWRERRYGREISYVNEHGRVSVSLLAIEEALTRAVGNEPGVRKVQCRVYEDRVKRLIVIDCVLTMWEQNNVSATNRSCQDVLRRRFAELMPEETSVQVNLTVHRLNHRDETQENAPGEVGTRAIEVPERTLTPGLALTGGGVGRDAGKDLLERTRKATAEEEGWQPTPDQPPPEPEPEDEEDSLYAGPAYPVDGDDDENIVGAALPADDPDRG